jgi:selenocysteine-specific elongation factor
LDPVVSEEAVKTLVESKRIVILGGKDNELTPRSFVIHRDIWDHYQNQAIKLISEYHQANPLRKGMPKEELKSRLNANPHVFNALILYLRNQEEVLEEGPFVFASGHVVEYTPTQQSQVDSLLDQFSRNPYNPPTIKDCLAKVGEELYNTLVDQAILIPISPEVVFRSKDCEEMIQSIKSLIKGSGAVTAGEVRDYFKTSRRYVLALLEYMDELGITIREGDQRRLRK